MALPAMFDGKNSADTTEVTHETVTLISKLSHEQQMQYVQYAIAAGKEALAWAAMKVADEGPETEAAKAVAESCKADKQEWADAVDELPGNLPEFRSEKSLNEFDAFGKEFAFLSEDMEKELTIGRHTDNDQYNADPIPLPITGDDGAVWNPTDDMDDSELLDIPFNPSDFTSSDGELSEKLAEIEDREILSDILEVESAAKDRKTAVEAINDRIAEIEDIPSDDSDDSDDSSDGSIEAVIAAKLENGEELSEFEKEAAMKILD
jgi:hypothetical protein